MQVVDVAYRYFNVASIRKLLWTDGLCGNIRHAGVGVCSI